RGAEEDAVERICVVGAGVIGSLFAGHLGRVAEVSVLTRREEHARALNADGLRVSGRHDFVTQLQAATDPASLPAPELAIVATKTTELAAAAAKLEGHWRGAAVMTVQNGLGAEAAFPDRRVLSAVHVLGRTRHPDPPVHGRVEEGKRVAAAAGVELHEDPWEMNVLATKRGSRHYPSMLEDVQAHRPTEIEHITGALVREASRAGVEVPLHTTLYRLVKGREASWEPD